MIIPALALLIAAQTTAPHLDYKDGFSIRSDDGLYTLNLRGFLQPRAEVIASQSDVATWATHFAIQRAQIELGGNVVSKDLTFLLRTELGQGLPFLKDGYANYVFVPEVLELRVGQWKRPFSRQELSSDWKLAFVERSETNRFFKAGRDIGIAVHNDVEKSRPLEWAVGLFGGETDKPSFTFDDTNPEKVVINETNVAGSVAPTLVGRIGLNQGDVKGYNEVDMDGGDLRFGVAGSVLETFETAGQSRGATRAEVDGILKIASFDVSGAAFASSTQIKGQQTLAQDYEATGVHVQAGYLIADRVHPAFRYDLVQRTSSSQQELTLGVNVYFYGQALQWQTDASALLNTEAGKPPETTRVRTQLGLRF